MKLLLTSGGITNPTIRTALVDLLGKPIEECRALAVPTAEYGHPFCNPESVRRFITGAYPDAVMCEAGWKSVGVLELTALPTIGAERWMPWVRETDVLLVDGGDANYLGYWLRQSGLADLLAMLPDLVWVGVSAGSMVMTPRIGDQFRQWKSPSGKEEEALGLVDFSIFPHLGYPDWPDNTLEAAHRWATKIPGPAYAIDDQTAISVIDGRTDVHSEGHWELLNPATT